LLFYWSMLRHGYWLTEFLTISNILKKAPAQYGRSFLYTEQDNGDLTYFFLYHLKVITRAINELDRYLARKVKELRETRVLLSATPGEYNHRQLALLELAIKDPQSMFTIESHARSHNVSFETARQDLHDLDKRGLLSRSKVGRHFTWSPASDLPSVIREVQYGEKGTLPH
jgi:Fic family protein